MTPDIVLAIALASLAIAGLPMVIWLRAQKRIRHLEMTLLVQTTDNERYEEIRTLLERLALQTEQVADQQAVLLQRMGDRPEILPPARSDSPRVQTPH